VFARFHHPGVGRAAYPGGVRGLVVVLVAVGALVVYREVKIRRGEAELGLR
jgi:hypothetical protein